MMVSNSGLKTDLEYLRKRFRHIYKSGLVTKWRGDMFDYSVKFKAIDNISKKINAINKRMEKMAGKARAASSKIQASLGRMNFRARLDMNVSRALANIKKVSVRLRSLGKQSKDLARRGVSIGLGAIAALAPIGKAMSAYQRIERAKGKISSLGVGELGIKKITDEATKFSNVFAGGDAADFVAASYDIKSGIESLSNSDVGKFTRLAALTGRATKSSVEEMTKLFALGHGIFRGQFKTDIEFGNKFSAAIATAVQAFRTDGGDLIQGISTLGATATGLGVSLEEQLAVLGMSKSAFNSASEGATSYRAVLAGVGKAQEYLGVSFVNSKGMMLPMADILDKIKGKYEKMGVSMKDVRVQDALRKAFGSIEATKMINALINKTDSLRKAQSKLNKNMKEGTAITEEMALAMQRGEEFNIFAQKMSNMGIAIGRVFAPAVLSIAKYVGDLALRIGAWVDVNPRLSSTLGKVLIVVGLIAAALSVLAIAFGVVGMAMGALTPILVIFSAALWANPITWVVIAVVALGAAIYQLIKYWDDIVWVANYFFGRIGDWVASTFTLENAIAGIAGVFGALTAPIRFVIDLIDLFLSKFDIYNKAKAQVTGIADSVSGAVSDAWSGAKGLLGIEGANTGIDNTTKNHTVVDVNVTASGGAEAAMKARSTGGVNLRKTVNGI